MKRNLLLLFVLIGLVVMEWGCCKGRAFYYDLTSVSSEVTATDTLSDKYSNIGFYILVNYDKQACLSSGSGVLVACDNDHNYTSTPQSMEISSNKPYRGLENFGKYFFVGDLSLEEWIKSGQSSFSQSLNLGLPPLKTDTFSFIFKVTDSQGSIFETTTEPIIITP